MIYSSLFRNHRLLFSLLPCVLATLLVVAAPEVKANDVHNFYFQKSKPTVEKPVEVKPKPAIQKIKVKEEAKKKSGFNKKWEGSFGIGVFTANDGGEYYASSSTRQAYVFGGRYFFNEFFDLNAEMFYDRGSNTYGGNVETHGPLFKLGVGTTLIHFTFLGYPFWEWGFDGGVLLGSQKYLDGENLLFFVGHRQSINFTRSWSLTYNVNVEISRVSNVRSATAGVKMAYRW